MLQHLSMQGSEIESLDWYEFIHHRKKLGEYLKQQADQQQEQNQQMEQQKSSRKSSKSKFRAPKFKMPKFK